MDDNTTLTPGKPEYAVAQDILYHKGNRAPWALLRSLLALSHGAASLVGCSSTEINDDKLRWTVLAVCNESYIIHITGTGPDEDTHYSTDRPHPVIEDLVASAYRGDVLTHVTTDPHPSEDKRNTQELRPGYTAHLAGLGSVRVDAATGAACLALLSGS